MEDISTIQRNAEEMNMEDLQRKAIFLQILEQQIGDPLWCSNNKEEKDRIMFVIYNLREELLNYPPLMEYYGKLSDTYIGLQNFGRNAGKTDLEVTTGTQSPLDLDSLVFHSRLIELLLKKDGLSLHDPEKYRRLRFLSDRIKNDLRNNPELLAFQGQAYEFYMQQQKAKQGDIAIK